MANLLTRNRNDFPFQNRKLSTDVQVAQEQQRKELVDLYNALQTQMANDFRQVAEKLYALELRIEALE